MCSPSLPVHETCRADSKKTPSNHVEYLVSRHEHSVRRSVSSCRTRGRMPADTVCNHRRRSQGGTILRICADENCKTHRQFSHYEISPQERGQRRKLARAIRVQKERSRIMQAVRQKLPPARARADFEMVALDHFRRLGHDNHHLCSAKIRYSRHSWQQIDLKCGVAHKRLTVASSGGMRSALALFRLASMLLDLAQDALRYLVLGTRSKAALKAENIFLRKQLALYLERKVKPRRATDATRLSMVLLSRLFVWQHALVSVRPETFLGWHRRGFRLLWRWKSRPRSQVNVWSRRMGLWRLGFCKSFAIWSSHSCSCSTEDA
jgi:hypothetical protein